MHPGFDAELSIRRCKKREDALIMLASLGEAHPRALAEAIGVDVTRLHWIMQGREGRYSEALSPISLGWAELATDARGRRFYRILPTGIRKARNLTARRVRASRRRRAASGPSEPAGDAGAPASHAAPEVRCTYTWSIRHEP